MKSTTKEVRCWRLHKQYPIEVSLLAMPAALEIVGVDGQGVLETIQWRDVMEYSATKGNDGSGAGMELFEFLVFGKGLLQFKCNAAETLVHAFEVCLREKETPVNCFLCFTIQDSSGHLPEEVSARSTKLRSNQRESNIILHCACAQVYLIPDEVGVRLLDRSKSRPLMKWRWCEISGFSAQRQSNDPTDMEVLGCIYKYWGT
jgi:hypothetical protein